MQTETIELDVEEVPQNELAIAGENITKGLSAFNERKASLETLAQSAAEITINGIEDKEGYKNADAKRKELKQARVSITKEGKEMRSILTQVGKNIIEKENELTSIISGEEQRLADEQDKIDAEKERIKQEEIKRQEQILTDRIKVLADYGFQIDFGEIKAMDDETFTQYAEAAKTRFEKAESDRKEAERLEAEKAETERLAKEAEAKKLADERAELEELRKKAAEAQRVIDEANRAKQDALDAETKRIDEEKAALLKEKLQAMRDKENARCDKLAQIGLMFDFVENSYVHESGICVGIVDVKTYDDAKWSEMVKKVSDHKIKYDSDQKAKIEQELREAAEKAAEEARLKLIQDQKDAKEAEKVRLSQLPDKKQINAYIASIQAIDVPVMKSANGKKIMTSIQELVGKLTSYSTEKANTL